MIGNRMKELRLEKGTTQKDLSDYLGLTPKMVSFYENGLRFPTQANISKIARYFDVTTDYLLGVSEVKTISGIDELKRLRVQLFNEHKKLADDKGKEEKKLKSLYSSLQDLKEQLNKCEYEILVTENNLTILNDSEIELKKKIADTESKLDKISQSTIPDKTDIFREVLPSLIKEFEKLFDGVECVVKDEGGNVLNDGKPINVMKFVENADFETKLKIFSLIISDIEFDKQNGRIDVKLKS